MDCNTVFKIQTKGTRRYTREYVLYRTKHEIATVGVSCSRQLVWSDTATVSPQTITSYFILFSVYSIDLEWGYMVN